MLVDLIREYMNIALGLFMGCDPQSFLEILEVVAFWVCCGSSNLNVSIFIALQDGYWLLQMTIIHYLSAPFASNLSTGIWSTRIMNFLFIAYMMIHLLQDEYWLPLTDHYSSTVCPILLLISQHHDLSCPSKCYVLCSI